METYFLIASVLSALILAKTLVDVVKVTKVRPPSKSKLTYLLEVIAVTLFAIPYFIFSTLKPKG